MKPAYLKCVIFCPKHAKTRLRASTGQKKFFVSPALAIKRRGEEGREGRELSPLEFKSGYALVVTNRLNLLDESKLTKALAFNC